MNLIMNGFNETLTNVYDTIPARQIWLKKRILPAVIASILMTGCSTLQSPDGSEEVRNKLTQLQSDPELSSRAPVAIKAAEIAVAEAEMTTLDEQLSRHRVFIADHKVDIAAAQAQSRLLEDQRKLLKEEAANARLDSRTREAELARIDANSARNDADVARNEAYEARMETEVAQQETATAMDAAYMAKQQADAAQQQADDLQKQLADLNAKTTERGLIVTLGDVLFDSGRAELKGNVSSHLGKLAAFLNKYPDRTITVEGHTDNIGNDDNNFSLSQRRADAVRVFLINQGIDAGRVSSVGKGESYPVSSNESSSGRQMNRRVEVIIANNATAASLQ